MKVDVVELPRDLRPEHVQGRSVVVFDVLRATTTIATALAAGAAAVRAFESLESAATARRAFGGEALLCGERRCLRPEGFDLGNSPAEYLAERVRGRTLFLSTTNGTRAIVAAAGASAMLAGALVNAGTTAAALQRLGNDVTLLCAGTGGEFAPEDMIGAGAVLAASGQTPGNPAAEEALRLFLAARDDLASALQATQGGQNILAANLQGDIVLAARLDALDLPVIIHGPPPVAVAMIRR
jgi:2-phosphosulfolactate phosphatase